MVGGGGGGGGARLFTCLLMEDIVQGTKGHVLTNHYQIRRLITTRQHRTHVGMGKYPETEKQNLSVRSFQNLMLYFFRRTETEDIPLESPGRFDE